MQRPDASFLFAHPSHLLACGLGSGLSPWAPGTAGTAFAWVMYLLIKPQFGDGAFLAFVAIAFAVGVVACDRTGRDLGVADHGAIVWDEIVPFWLVLLLTPPGIFWQAARNNMGRIGIEPTKDEGTLVTLILPVFEES